MRVLYFGILLSCFKTSVCVNVTKRTLTTPAVSKQNFKIGEESNQFVDLLKQDLRRDNDDYEAERSSRPFTNKTTAKVPTTSPSNNKKPSEFRRMAHRDSFKTIAPIPEDNFSIAPPSAEPYPAPDEPMEPDEEPIPVELQETPSPAPDSRLQPIVPILPHQPHKESKATDLPIGEDKAVFRASDEETTSSLGFGSVSMRHFKPVRRRPSSPISPGRHRMKLGSLLPQPSIAQTTTEKTLEDLQKLTKNKLQKFRQLLFKNKDLLRRFVSFKQHHSTGAMPGARQIAPVPIRQPQMPIPQGPVPMPEAPMPMPEEPMPEEPMPEEPMPQAPVMHTAAPINVITMLPQGGMRHSIGPPGSLRKSIHARKRRQRHRKRHHEKQIERQGKFLLSEEHLPNDEQLDMAPAKGARIDHMRMKGRVCHRHVLMPEGPKYDSKGHVYLKEFTPPKANIDYASTNQPHLLLPRCCNCCKKSVLGCE